MSDSETESQEFMEQVLAAADGFEELEGPQIIGPVEVTLTTIVHSARTPAEAVEFVILNLARNGLQDRFYQVTEVEPPSKGEQPGQWLVRDGHTLTEEEVQLLYASVTSELDEKGVPAPPSPLSVACQDCGAEAGKACKPLGNQPKNSIGYHDARYRDAGWPVEPEAEDAEDDQG